jgi:mannose-6-phosphate isomerase
VVPFLFGQSVIQKLSPTIVRKIWGGRNLEKLKSIPESLEGSGPIGETWEVNLGHLPYLVKLIDTEQELSIQVHPGDEYARLHENSLGKTECWIILEAKPGEGIYLGLKPGVTREVLVQALAEQTRIDQLLVFHPVVAGDFFYVPAGSIHAIGKGILLAEVQQNSGITYRVWDWNRFDDAGKPRELHVEKSLEVINFDQAANNEEFFKKMNNLFSKKGFNEICKHSHFHLFLLNQKANEIHKQDVNLTRPCSLLNLSGKKKVNGEILEAYSAMLIDNEANIQIESLEAGSAILIF